MFTALPLTSETSGLDSQQYDHGQPPRTGRFRELSPTQVHRPATPVLPGWPSSRGSPSSFLTTVPLTEDFDDLINNPLDTLASELPSSLPDTPQFQPQWACPCQAPTPNPSSPQLSPPVHHNLDAPGHWPTCPTWSSGAAVPITALRRPLETPAFPAP